MCVKNKTPAALWENCGGKIRMNKKIPAFKKKYCQNSEVHSEGKKENQTNKTFLNKKSSLLSFRLLPAVLTLENLEQQMYNATSKKPKQKSTTKKSYLCF